MFHTINILFIIAKMILKCLIPDSIEPTEILPYAYLHVGIFPIHFPTENYGVASLSEHEPLCFHGLLAPSEC